MNDRALIQKAANTVRTLSADAIQKAKSGHPGMPLGCADFAFTLFYKYLRFNPANPAWIARDRFVLSAGHGSMLLYSLLHLFEYGITLDELKNFRQYESRTAGHPEHGFCPGVDVTTGPLGSGFASAVGMGIAAKNFGERTGLTAAGLCDSKIFVMMGDGCMMEGSASEAASLAGHLKLDNVIAFYDSNQITIEGGTELAFSENVPARFDAYGWRIVMMENANDITQCEAAIEAALGPDKDHRPTLIVGPTTIAFGAPNKQGKASAHGEPLGDDEIAALKKNLDMPEDAFCVPEDVSSLCHQRVLELKAMASQFDRDFEKFLGSNVESAELISSLLSKSMPENLLEELLKAAKCDKPTASRATGGAVLSKAGELVPALFGGAADLAPSTKTVLKDGYFSPETLAGRNIHFGVREFGMGLVCNGMSLYGSAIPFCSTFFVFSDYMKPAIRLAALMNLHELFIFTHDSFYVGEDGPTHEPIEQLAMLRSIPNLAIYRPADANETAHAFNAALRNSGPAVILLTRQNLRPLSPEMAARIDANMGAYVLCEDEDFDVIIIATGSEVNLALDAAAELRKMNLGVRVVSMISQERFLEQSEEYREEILPSWCGCRISIEAGTTFGWHRFVGLDGLAIGIDHFGASAPAEILAEKFGFTVDGVLARVAEHFIMQDNDDSDCGCGCGCEEHHHE